MIRGTINKEYINNYQLKSLKDKQDETNKKLEIIGDHILAMEAAIMEMQRLFINQDDEQ